jgi:hypothetical protein
MSTINHEDLETVDFTLTLQNGIKCTVLDVLTIFDKYFPYLQNVVLLFMGFGESCEDLIKCLTIISSVASHNTKIK